MSKHIIRTEVDGVTAYNNFSGRPFAAAWHMLKLFLRGQEFISVRAASYGDAIEMLQRVEARL